MLGANKINCAKPMNITKLSRNDPCHCGSGKKYKQCCQALDEQKTNTSSRLQADIPRLFNKALKHQEANELSIAEDLYKQILKISPKHVDTLYHLGILTIKTNNPETAIQLLRKASSLEPSAKIYCSLAQAHQSLKQIDEALLYFNKAIELNPGDANAYNNLGSQYLMDDHYEKAIQFFKKAIHLNREHDIAISNIGLCFMRKGEYHEAISYFKRAISITPHEMYYRNLLLCLCFDRQEFSKSYLNIARQLDDLLSSRAKPYKQWNVENNHPLRIGFVSGDFRNHPVGYFLESLITHIDSTKLELYAYNSQSSKDDLTDRISPYFSKWTDIFALNDEQAAQQIHTDGIHILVDLAGYTANSRLRLFVWKPAPIQVSWLGYFASTGLRCIDFFLADPISVPKTHLAQFTETVRYLPHTRLCFTPPDETYTPKVSPLPAHSNGFVTFGCFQNLSKVNNKTLAIWAEILHFCPTARLLLKSNLFQDKQFKEEMRHRLISLNIPIDRVIFEEGSPRTQYLESYQRADFMLDTFPFPGGTTTCEALWMGVPTLTLAGDTLLERQGMSMLNCVGLDDWVAHSEKEYIDKAIHFTKQLDYLTALRSTLRKKMAESPLVNATLFARDFEQAMLEMWQAKSDKNI